MRLSHEQPNGQSNATKRRKLNEPSEESTTSQAVDSLFAALELDAPTNEEELDSPRILQVFPNQSINRIIH